MKRCAKTITCFNQIYVVTYSIPGTCVKKHIVVHVYARVARGQASVPGSE